MDELRKLLSEQPISSLVEQDDVLSLEHNQTVADALKLLARHDILSAPLVVSPGLEDIESLEPTETAASLVGWLDIKDIIKAFLAFLHEHKHHLPTNMLSLMTELEKQGPNFATKMLITVVGSEDRGLVYQTDADVSVLTAIRDFFLGQPDAGRLVHRLAIFDSHGDITRIVSQMDVLRLLRKHIDELGPCASQSLEQLGLYKPDMLGELIKLAPTTPTLLAYEQLADAGVTGAPVVSPDGQLIANLSISDIRGIQPDHFGVLALPVAEFLAVKHGTAYLGYSQHSSTSSKHPFFASGPPSAGRRPTGADAADAEAAAAAAAAHSPRAGAAAANGAAAAEGGEGGSPTSGGHQHQHQHHHHRTSRRPSSEVGLRLITAAPEATLATVLCQMVDNSVHRVYICTESEKGQEVVGVVTPTDILSLVAGQAGWLRRTLSTRSNGMKRPASEAASAEAAAAALDAMCEAAEEAEAVAAAAAAADGGAADGDAAEQDAANLHKKAKVDDGSD